MARQSVITKEQVLCTAFEMAKEEGFEGVTARRLAAKAGCSTQPIFRLYQNMEELHEEVMNRAVVYFREFYDAFPKNQELPFLNLALAYISFAGKEGNVFRMLFLQEHGGERSFYDILNGDVGNVSGEIKKASDQGRGNAQALFMKFWIFVHGMACMTITGDYDLGMDETISMLKNAYQNFS